jgi:hypothetical protein
MRKTYNKKTTKKILGFKKVKRRRKKNNSRNLIFTIIGVLVFAGLSGIGISVLTPKTNTQTMEISGIDKNSSVKPEEFKKAAEETFNLSYSVMGTKIEAQNFLVSNQKKIASLLEKFPQIENIEMKKDSNGGIVFDVKEKTPFAIWCEGEKCSLIDGKGTYIRDYNNEAEYSGLPKISKQEWTDNAEYKSKAIEYIVKISESLSKNDHFKQQVYSVFSDKFTVKGDAPCELIFDPNEDISWQLEKMETILRNEEYINNLSNYQYIDLRFKNQAIIK